MIRLSYREIDKEYSLTPEQSDIRSRMIDDISMSLINEAWVEFYNKVVQEVDEAIEKHIEPIIQNNPLYKRVKELDALWDKLSIEVRQGKIDNSEADRISEDGYEAEQELEEYKNNLKQNMEPIRNAMIAQIINWKVD
jgi:hypothetical protein